MLFLASSVYLHSVLSTPATFSFSLLLPSTPFTTYSPLFTNNNLISTGSLATHFHQPHNSPPLISPPHIYHTLTRDGSSKWLNFTYYATALCVSLGCGSYGIAPRVWTLVVRNMLVEHGMAGTCSMAIYSACLNHIHHP